MKTKLKTLLKNIDVKDVVTTKRFGGSYYLIIPARLAVELGINEGDEYILFIDSEGRLIYEPKRRGDESRG